MDFALQLLTVLNQTGIIADLVLLAKRKDGGVTVIPVLDEADAKFKENIEKAKAWLAQHQS